MTPISVWNDKPGDDLCLFPAKEYLITRLPFGKRSIDPFLTPFPLPSFPECVDTMKRITLHSEQKGHYTFTPSFLTSDPSNLFLLLFRCFCVNTTKASRMRTATTMREHTTTRVTTHHPPPPFPPFDHSPRMSYSQMHSFCSVKPFGVSGLLPTIHQSPAHPLLMLIVTPVVIPISCFTI